MICQPTERGPTGEKFQTSGFSFLGYSQEKISGCYFTDEENKVVNANT